MAFLEAGMLREAREKRMMERPAGMRQALNVQPVIRDSFGALVISRWVNGRSEYLHSDGIWRSTCKNEKNEWTGFFFSKKEAEYILDWALGGYVI